MPPPPAVRTALEAIAEATRAIDEAASPPDAYDDLHRLVLGVLRLGLALEREPGAAGAEVRARLRADGDALAERLPLLSYYLARWEQRFCGAWEGEWRVACEARSGLEFMRTLYAGTALEGAFADELDPGELDDLMRARAMHDGGVPDEAIPAGIPPSHWWWWAPDPPPAA